MRRYALSADELDTLIGVKPPYIGWERGGMLTNHVIEFPRCVIYLRGIEQTTPAVQDLFRAILEKGFCEDGRGQQVTFREAILIFAHDMGVETERRIGFGRQPTQPAALFDPSRLMRQLEESGFPEAILDCISAVVPFQPLDSATLYAIAARALEQLQRRFYEQEGKALQYEPALLDWLLQSDTDIQPEDIQRRIEQVLRPLLRRAKIQLAEQWNQIETVQLRLNLHEPEATPPRPRILVYDDLPDFHQALQEQFPDFEWFHASDLETAATLLRQHRPHLVLIDTCLQASDPADTGGIHVLQTLRQRHPEPLYILVTAQAVGFETTREAFRAGAYDYLYKPPNESVLRQLAQTLVEREQQQRKLALQQSLLQHYQNLTAQVQFQQGVALISLQQSQPV